MDRPETLLVLRAQSGDRAALGEVFQGVQDALHRYLRRLTGDASLADDVLQEVFVKVYRKLAWLDDPALFRPWVYRIASREAFKALKAERRWRAQIRDEETLVMVASPEEPPPATDVAKLLDRLSPASRGVLILHYLDEMPLLDVAAILSIPLGTAKSRLAYGLATLRRLLTENTNDR
ncbi:MAG TPA: RNA polymerase sigma factor [Thermoanaerobaculia bacterium]|jgi:RNA polymerase sigma-70 factor (ECF subfamily)|nr:RNA polymerase sigma factor [Thermoanaerobaculia bacterium]